MPNPEQSTCVVSQHLPVTHTLPEPHCPFDAQGLPRLYWLQNPLTHAWPEGQLEKVKHSGLPPPLLPPVGGGELTHLFVVRLQDPWVHVDPAQHFSPMSPQGARHTLLKLQRRP